MTFKNTLLDGIAYMHLAFYSSSISKKGCRPKYSYSEISNADNSIKESRLVARWE